MLVERLTVPVPRFFDVVSEPAQVHEDTELLALWTPAWEPHTTVDLVARSMSEDTKHTVSNVPDDGIEVLPENVSPTDLEVGSAYVLFYEVTKTKELIRAGDPRGRPPRASEGGRTRLAASAPSESPRGSRPVKYTPGVPGRLESP